MKNKMLSLLLSAALTLGCAVPAFAAEDGLPASDAPAAAEAAESGLWITAEAAQALAFAKSVNDGESYQGQYISLNSDIDLSGIDWTPIGTSNSFKGVFDGNQYVIENPTIGSQAAAAERDAAGLFGDLGSGGVIRSVGIRDALIYNYYAGSQYVGLLASGTSANSVVDNCWATGTIASGGTSTDTEKYSNIGGLIGASGLKSLVANSWSDVTILSVSDTINAVGGVVGGTSYMAAAYNCYFNSDAKQSYYGGEVSEPVAVGYDALNYTPSDNEHCEGLPESGIYGAALLEKLSAALEEDQLSAAQAWFTDQQLFSGDVTLDGYLFMTDAGWNSWEKDSSGRLLPTGPSSNFPEEPDCFDGGDGSKADPYVISTEEHLRAFAAATVSGKLVTANRYFRLGADIALSGAWTPIHNFAGSFDGDGHTVSGMTIGTETSPAGSAAVGFFDSLPEGASVQNLKLTGAAVCVQASGYDRCFAGALVGGANGVGRNVTIDRCSATGSAVSVQSEFYSYAGGLIGLLTTDTVVTNCWADIPVSARIAENPAWARP